MTKIVMQVYDPTSQTPAIRLFAQADNRMVLGSVSGAESRWGLDPAKPEVRFFLDHEAAVEYIKGKCREYCGRDDIDFLYESGTPMVQGARQALRN